MRTRWCDENFEEIEAQENDKKLLLAGIFKNENTDRFKHICLIIIPKEGNCCKWKKCGAWVKVENAEIIDLDPSRAYNESKAEHESWQNGYDMAMENLQDEEALREEYGEDYEQYVEEQKEYEEPAVSFYEWLENEIGEVVSEQLFSERDCYGCPARDKYWKFLDNLHYEFYDGVDDAKYEFFKKKMWLKKKRKVGK